MSSSDVSSVTKYFSTAAEGFSTTTSGTISAGATSVGLNSTTGLTNGNVFVGIIEPGATAQQVFTGTVDVSGSQITNVAWVRDTNVGHAGGVTVVDYVSGAAHNMATTGILKQHTQAGAHTGITTDTLTVTSGTTLPAGDIGTADIAAGAVDGTKLSTSAITLGYAQITGNISTQATSATLATGLTSTVTVPAGGRRVKITVSGGNLVVGTNAKNLYVGIWSGTVGSGTRLGEAQFTQANANYSVPITLVASDTPSAGSVTYNVGYYTDAGPVTLTWNVSATSPAFILVEAV
jgi:hypothetical protein